MNWKTGNDGLGEGRTGAFLAEGWLRDAVMIALALAIGWWAHTPQAVQAQNPDLLFQIHGLDQSTGLTLYYPDQKTIYVYPNALAGFPTLNCAYMFRLGEPGGAVQRQQCKMPSFQP